MKQRTLPEPKLEIAERWKAAMTMRWRIRHGRRWIYAGWWYEARYPWARRRRRERPRRVT